MDAGSVLLYTGTVFHGGGANGSDADRWGLNITYALGWLRQEENQYLSCPPEIARTLEPELQAMLGYAMGNYALGYYTPPLPPGEGPETRAAAVCPGRRAGDAGDDGRGGAAGGDRRGGAARGGPGGGVGLVGDRGAGVALDGFEVDAFVALAGLELLAVDAALGGHLGAGNGVLEADLLALGGTFLPITRP